VNCLNGHAMAPGDRFCRVCGAGPAAPGFPAPPPPLGGLPEPPAPADTGVGPSPSRKALAWWIGGTLAAAGAAVALVLVFASGDGGPGTTAAGPTTTASASSTTSTPATTSTSTTGPATTSTSLTSTSTTQPPPVTFDGATWDAVAGAALGGAGGQQIFDVVARRDGLVVAVGQDTSSGTVVGTSWGRDDAGQWVKAGTAPPPAGYQQSQLLAVTEMPDGSLLALGRVNNAATPTVVSWTSADGISWTPGPVTLTPQAGGVYDLVAHAGGFTAVGYALSAGQMDLAWWESPDGLTWTEATLAEPGDQAAFAVAVFGDRLVAVGVGQADADGTMTAGPAGEDAVVWSAPVAGGGFARTAAAGLAGPDLELAWDIVPGGPGLVVVGRAGPAGQPSDAAVWTSADGIAWARQGLGAAALGGPGHDVMDAVLVVDGTMVAVGRTGPADASELAVWESRDGSTWDRVWEQAMAGGRSVRLVNSLAWHPAVGLVIGGVASAGGEPDAVLWVGQPASGGGTATAGGLWERLVPDPGFLGVTGVEAVGSDGRVWVSLWESGSPATGLWVVEHDAWTQVPGLPSADVAGVAFGRYGVEWVAFTYDGIYSSQGGQLLKEGEGFDLRAIAATDDWVVVGGFDGASVWWDGSAWMGRPPDPMLEGLRVLAAAPNGDLWAAGYAGPVRWDGAAWVQPAGVPAELSGNAGDPVNDIAVAPDGTLWIATESRGIYRFDGSNWFNYPMAGPGGDQAVAALAVADNGAVWAASPSGWLAHYLSLEGDTFFYHPYADGATFTSVAVGPAGAVWVGTVSDGLLRFTR